MNRTKTRIVAFELIYSLEIQKIEKEEVNTQIDLFLELSEIKDDNVEKYVKDTINGVLYNKDSIIKSIENELSEKWDIRRVSKINMAILKLAIYEIIYSNLPYKVVINEAVEIAKVYGDDNSASFVNGILASVVKKNNIEE